jgi:hypothetical protein
VNVIFELFVNHPLAKSQTNSNLIKTDEILATSRNDEIRNRNARPSQIRGDDVRRVRPVLEEQHASSVNKGTCKFGGDCCALRVIAERHDVSVLSTLE